jgi:hypothetical protein
LRVLQRHLSAQNGASRLSSFSRARQCGRGAQLFHQARYEGIASGIRFQRFRDSFDDLLKAGLIEERWSEMVGQDVFDERALELMVEETFVGGQSGEGIGLTCALDFSLRRALPGSIGPVAFLDTALQEAGQAVYIDDRIQNAPPGSVLKRLEPLSRSSSPVLWAG